MAKLSSKHNAFVSEYIKDWNGAAAARRAGYKGKSNVIAARLLANVSIQEEIKRRLDEKAMSADEVLTRLAEQARANIEGFLQFPKKGNKPTLDLKQAQENGLLHLIKKLKYNTQGQIEIELHDAQTALQLIGKHHGLFTEKVEMVGLEDVLRGLPSEFGDAVRAALTEALRKE